MTNRTISPLGFFVLRTVETGWTSPRQMAHFTIYADGRVESDSAKTHATSGERQLCLTSELVAILHYAWEEMELGLIIPDFIEIVPEYEQPQQPRHPCELVSCYRVSVMLPEEKHGRFFIIEEPALQKYMKPEVSGRVDQEAA